MEELCYNINGVSMEISIAEKQTSFLGYLSGEVNAETCTNDHE